MMEQQRVTSSNIDMVGHDGTSLFIRFVKGKCYQYLDCPHQIYHSLVRSESAGKFFHQFVKEKYASAALDYDPFVEGLRRAA